MKKISNHWLLLFLCAAVVSGLSVAVSSCSSSKDPAKAAVADFTYVIDTETPSKVTFTNTTKDGKTYSWDFGDGSALSTEESPTHEFSVGGTYTVSLTAQGAAGATSKKTSTFAVEGTNLLQGGTMETADASKWNITQLDQAKDHYKFGETNNLPTGGSGGGFSVFDSTTERNSESTLFWQLVTLKAGKSYRFSALFNKAAAANPPGTGDADDDPSLSFRFWYETYVALDTGACVPVTGAGYDFGSTPYLISGMDGFNCDIPKFDGEFNELTDPCKGSADQKGIFTVTADGQYVFGLRIGKYFGHYGAGGMVMDNLKLYEVND